MSATVPIVGFIGWSGNGKTTLLSKVLPIFRQTGIRVGVVKHTHHNVEFDTPGKDSHTLRTSGAEQMLVTSAKRWALFGDKENTNETLDVREEVARMNTAALDIVLVESFKTAAIPKIELYRPSIGKSPLYINDSNIIAVACDEMIEAKSSCVILDLNKPQEIADYIIRTFLPSHSKSAR